MAIGTSESVGIWPRGINQCTQTIGMDVSTHIKHGFINAVTQTRMLNIRFSIILVLTAAHGALGARHARAQKGLCCASTLSGLFVPAMEGN